MLITSYTTSIAYETRYILQIAYMVTRAAIQEKHFVLIATMPWIAKAILRKSIAQ